jgi:hypothetical protein
MTHYSENPGMVRVDYFKASGKWYMTHSVDMARFWDYGLIPHEAIEAALEAKGRWLPHFTMVILNPYHKNGHPVMFPAVES